MTNQVPVVNIEDTEDGRAEVRVRNTPTRQAQQQEQEHERELKYGAEHVIRLFAPVSVCMGFVIFTMSTIKYYSQDDGVYLVYTPFTKATDSTAEKFAMSIGNALVVLSLVVVMTGVLIALYWFKFYKFIHGWLMFSSLMLLSVFTTMYFQELFKAYNVVIDHITYFFLLYNFAVMGMICIHWKGPLQLQQSYLIVISGIMALVLIKYMPDWTVWSVLIVLALWDIIAVLCPHGPLRILVETAQQRNEPIFPALIYSSTVVYPYVVFNAVINSANAEQPLAVNVAPPDVHDANHGQNEMPVRIAPARHRGRRSQQGQQRERDRERQEVGRNTPRRQDQNSRASEEIEDQGVKLGLGDFIFYSVLVGKASSYGDWNITIACYVSILIGLAFTLMLLAVFRKALPALPISIFAGVMFYFATYFFITPFLNEMAMRQIVP